MHDRTKTEVRVARAAAKSNSSLLSALQTSQVLNISPYAQLQHELIFFITLSKRSMQQLTENFIIVGRAQSSIRQCLREYIFYPHS